MMNSMADEKTLVINPSSGEYGEDNHKLLYHTDVFDGPLDLLLTLIAKNKIDICILYSSYSPLTLESKSQKIMG